MIKQHISKKKNQIIELLQDIGEFNFIEEIKNNIRVMQDYFRRLNEALNILKILNEAATEFDDFTNKKFTDI